MTAKDFDDRALPPGQIEAPAPSNELLNAVQGMKPVRTRTRFGGLAAVALLGLVWPALVPFIGCPALAPAMSITQRYPRIDAVALSHGLRDHYPRPALSPQ